MTAAATNTPTKTVMGAALRGNFKTFRLMIRAIGCAFVIAVSSVPPAVAANDLSNSLAALQQRDEMVQSVGWKLVTGNAPFCPETRLAAGLLLQDVAAYSQAEAVRNAMGLGGDIAVQARAAGSPAQRAGLPVHAEVLAIEGRSMRNLPPTGEQSWQRLADIHRKMDATLAEKGSLEVEWRSAEHAPTLTKLAGEPACASSFEVIAGSRRVSANGQRVAVGADFAGFDYPEELFAAAIAHELAHNVLGHPAWLDKNGRKRRNIRLTEREADRLMPWLLANGGYDPAAAEKFMRTWGPGNDGGLFRDRTHDGWDERAEFIAAELPAIRRSRANSQVSNGKADWAHHFVRDIQPAAVASTVASSAVSPNE